MWLKNTCCRYRLSVQHHILHVSNHTRKLDVQTVTSLDFIAFSWSEFPLFYPDKALLNIHGTSSLLWLNTDLGVDYCNRLNVSHKTNRTSVLNQVRVRHWKFYLYWFHPWVYSFHSRVYLFGSCMFLFRKKKQSFLSFFLLGIPLSEYDWTINNPK